MITVMRLQYAVVSIFRTVTDRFLSTGQKLPEGWVKLAGYDIYPWSVSGLETCVVLKQDSRLRMAFDLGYACRESVPCNHVFISHGHMDHVSGVVQHASKRGLYGMKPANYYVPQELTDPLHNIGKLCSDMSTLELPVQLHPVQPEQKIQLPGNKFVVPFPTMHRIVSQGYLVYQKVYNLKEEYKGLSNTEIRELQQQGTDIHNTKSIPEVAYTGDTTFELYKEPPLEDILKVKLLITELTYIHQSPKKNMVAMARDRGHVHLDEFIQNAHLFTDVGAILFIHLSDRYSENDIQRTMVSRLPQSLRRKVHIACLPNNGGPVIKRVPPYYCVVVFASFLTGIGFLLMVMVGTWFILYTLPCMCWGVHCCNQVFCVSVLLSSEILYPLLLQLCVDFDETSHACYASQDMIAITFCKFSQVYMLSCQTCFKGHLYITNTCL